MLLRPETSGSWKFIRRKVSSVLFERSFSPLLQAFLLGLVLGAIVFGTPPLVSDGETKSIPASSVPVLLVTPAPSIVSSSSSSSSATSVSSSPTTAVPEATSTAAPVESRPYLTVAGVRHPFSDAAYAWNDIAKNVSGVQAPTPPQTKARVALYVLVKSAPSYAARRALCRKHWQWRSNERKTFIRGLVAQQFLIGESNESAVTEALKKENAEFGDILIYPGADTYRRLPWKVLWGMKYVADHFDYDMLLLMDDDSFVNYPMALRFTASQLAERIYAGQLVGMQPKVQRNTKDQWYVPRSVYAPDFYPPYHWGAGYFLSSDLVTAILQESTHHDILWIDDAFMAILLNATNMQINIQDIRVYAVPDWAIFLCCEPSPIVLGSRDAKKMLRVGNYQQNLNPLCRFRRSKHCKRHTSI